MYYFIVNPKSKSGRGLAVWNEVKKVLDKKHIEYSYYVTTHKGHATKFAAEISNIQSESRKFVVVVGGDGTVNEVINGLHDYTNCVLGYIPTGKNNDLAKGLGIPSDPIEALNIVIETHKFIKVDHGTTTLLDSKDNYTKKFSTSTGMGLDANICNEAINSGLRNALTKIKLGWLSYLIITFKQVLSLKFTDAKVYIDGTEKKYNQMAFVASLIQKRDGGLCLAPKAKYNDQKLSVCIVYGMSKLKIMYLLPTLLFGKHLNMDGVDVFTCSELEVITDKKLIVHVDGEYAGRSNHIKNHCLETQIYMPHR
ncbi:MAG: YegS/Rv2252/BmrU family lipid kinase [Lachnospiraceae bacterium]|nr:YegS/Rv2252/BmrU family lipid kinase [Lachnospiraceae bacterium]